ncbi:MAG: PIN domain-containing protein [Methanoregula sp.]|nr:PIN domain-containing protein [Methanoregula sp.]
MEDQFLVRELCDLLNDVNVVMIGPIRQELLSGIASPVQFDALKEKLQAFEDLELSREYYERAAEYYNTCRGAGVQGSHIDFLICATAVEAGMQIFTSDKDFLLYAKHLPISLFHPAGTTHF